MNIEPLTSTPRLGLIPDIPDVADSAKPSASSPATADQAAHLFTQALDASAQVFQAAQHSEHQVANGHGSILDMSIDRARADALLNVLSAAASKVASALSTFSNMAV